MRRHAPSQAGRSTCSLLLRFLTTPTIARVLTVSCFSFFCVFFIPTSFAQVDSSLQNLIFEPVLISVEPLSSEPEDQPTTNPKVTEITTLPKGDGVEVDELYDSEKIEEISELPTTRNKGVNTYEEKSNSAKESSVSDGNFVFNLEKIIGYFKEGHLSESEFKTAKERLLGDGVNSE